MIFWFWTDFVSRTLWSILRIYFFVFTVKLNKHLSTVQPPCAITASIIYNFSLYTVYVPSPLFCSLSLELCLMITDFSFFPFSLPSPAAGDNGFLSRVMNIHDNIFAAAESLRWPVYGHFGHVQHSSTNEAIHCTLLICKYMQVCQQRGWWLLY